MTFLKGIGIAIWSKYWTEPGNGLHKKVNGIFLTIFDDDDASKSKKDWKLREKEKWNWKL